MIVATVILLSVSGGWPQEFEPRAYAVAPVGLNFLAIGYGYSNGAVFMDPALPVDDVDADIHAVLVRYVRTLSLFGLPSKIKVGLPWTDGHWEGMVEGEFRTRDSVGLADARVVIETQFSGAEVRNVSEFRGYTPAPTVWGARLQVIVPIGDYDSTRAINLGANRWGLIPELGFGRAVGRWSFEGALGVWLFGDNDDYYGGHYFEQDPLLVAKLHAIRTIRPGFWWAVSAGYGYGGRTTMDGVRRDTIQRNWRISAMVAYPITPTQGLSVSVLTGGNAGAGTDFDAIAVGYQIAWGGG